MRRGTELNDVSFDLYPGEVLGVVALEGQGQDELFDILAGSERPTSGELLVDGSPVSFRHPADAIRAGLVYVPADRAEALLMQRSVRENIALPWTAPLRRWGLDQDSAPSARESTTGSTRLQIDTRAQGEVRRLSGGNQQKVTIARWVAGGVHAMLCFDPTRGIDIRTKQQIYVLLRDLAEAGAAVLLYTSELKEIQLACDRAIVIFGGRVVAEIAVADADEPTLLRAAYNLRSDAQMPEEIAAEVVAAEAETGATTDASAVTDAGAAIDPAAEPEPPQPGRRPMSAATATVDDLRPRPADALASFAQRNGWMVGLVGFLALLLVFTKLIQPSYGVTGVQGLAISVLPLALAAVGQAIVVISGGIDLSIGAMMALTSVVSATLMKGQSEEFGVAVVLGVLLLGLVLGAINGSLVVLTRVPDIVVTLAMSFVWAGCALLVLKTPGGGSANWLKDLVSGHLRQRMDPEGCGRPARDRGPDLDPAPTVAAGPVDLRHRQQPAGGVPQWRAGRSDEDRRLHADRPVRRARRPGAHREHRHRDPGARAVHAAERGGGRPRRRQPGRRPGWGLRADRGRHDPAARSGPT